MKELILAILIFFLLLLTVAEAGWYYNGQVVPTGTTINGKTCQADGSWD